LRVIVAPVGVGSLTPTLASLFDNVQILPASTTRGFLNAESSNASKDLVST
jgi:hypothetical protein